MVVYISARKKLIHAMSLNIDRPINRAPVVGCAISATRNHLKLNMPGTLNPLLGNIHAETRKLRKRSAMRVAASRTDAVHQSTNRPLMHSACPPRCLLPLVGSSAGMHVASCRRCAYHRERRRHAILIAHAACRVPHFRDFVPWRFLDAGRPSARNRSSLPASKNLHKCRQREPANLSTKFVAGGFRLRLQFAEKGD